MRSEEHIRRTFHNQFQNRFISAKEISDLLFGFGKLESILAIFYHPALLQSSPRIWSAAAQSLSLFASHRLWASSITSLGTSCFTSSFTSIIRPKASQLPEIPTGSTRVQTPSLQVLHDPMPLPSPEPTKATAQCLRGIQIRKQGLCTE